MLTFEISDIDRHPFVFETSEIINQLRMFSDLSGRHLSPPSYPIYQFISVHSCSFKVKAFAQKVKLKFRQLSFQLFSLFQSYNFLI